MIALRGRLFDPLFQIVSKSYVKFIITFTQHDVGKEHYIIPHAGSGEAGASASNSYLP